MANPLLEQLAPIAEPAAPGMWPLAYGWWLVIVAVLLLITFSVIKLRARHEFWTIRRIALTRLAQCQDHSQINQLLKQVALHYYPNVEVAPLQGTPWASFLAKNLPGDDEKIQAIISGLYQRESAESHEQFKHLARRWLDALTMKSIEEANNA